MFSMLALALLAAFTASAAELPPGRIVESVPCAKDASQSYALFVPSYYSAQRLWPVIFAFDPAARGRLPVERYQAAAERYGYIVAGSNNSRNGSWGGSTAALAAMTSDVMDRFPIDPQRQYVAGMSGGARVAMAVALRTPQVAGVFASSAGFPDSTPRKKVPFAVFATAGNEDFNYLEMRDLDRTLTSPHRLAVFQGGHGWLSSELAMEAVEWMELEAMRAGRKPRDQAEIDRIFAQRVAAVKTGEPGLETWLALDGLAKDFDGLKDVSELAARAAALGRDKRVREALKRDRLEDERERRTTAQIVAAEGRLPSDDRMAALAELKLNWKTLFTAATATEDSAGRRMARRILRGLAMSANERTVDPDYRKIIDEFRLPRVSAP